MQAIEKSIAISEVIKHCAEITAKLAPIAFPRKRPRMCKRMPARAHRCRRTQARARIQAQVELAITFAMSSFQTYAIISKPIKKYPPGGALIEDAKQTEAYVRSGNTDGPEGQEYCSGSSAFKTPAIQPLPAGQRDYIRALVLGKLDGSR